MNELEPVKDFFTDVYTWMAAAAAVVIGWFTYVKTLYADVTKDWEPKTRKLVGIAIGFAVFVLAFLIVARVLA